MCRRRSMRPRRHFRGGGGCRAPPGPSTFTLGRGDRGSARGAGAGSSRARWASRSARRAARSRAASSILRYYAGEAVREVGEVIPAQARRLLQFTLREPLGVVGADHAVELPARDPAVEGRAGAGLREHRRAQAGGAVVAVGDRCWPRCAAAAGLPAGVFNVVLGAGAVDGRRAPASRAGARGQLHRLGPVWARGSRRPRRQRNIRYQTEMGGKNVAIVLPDADLEQAAVLTAARRDALRRAEVHGDESRRRRARGRGRASSSGCARRSRRSRSARSTTSRRRSGR